MLIFLVVLIAIKKADEDDSTPAWTDQDLNSISAPAGGGGDSLSHPVAGGGDSISVPADGGDDSTFAPPDKLIWSKKWRSQIKLLDKEWIEKKKSGKKLTCDYEKVKINTPEYYCYFCFETS